jgi:hypothetical protein
MVLQHLHKNLSFPTKYALTTALNLMKQFIPFIIAALLFSLSSLAQVTNSSYTTSTGEKVLQLSIEVPLDKKAAWKLFTEDEQLKRWIAPLAHIEL